jgi:hypothetical protein
MNVHLPLVQNLILKNGSGFLCKDDLQLLRSWKSRMLPKYDNILTSNGRLRMRNRSRMETRLKKLFDTIKSSKEVTVKVTNILRTFQSAEEYLKGSTKLASIAPKIEQIPINKDYLLKFPDLCKKYLNVSVIVIFLKFNFF